MTILPPPDEIIQANEEMEQAAQIYVACLRQGLACLDFSQPGNKVKGHAIINLLADIQNTHVVLERAEHDAQTVRTPTVTNVLNAR